MDTIHSSLPTFIEIVKVCFICTCLLTYSMVQSPSWETNWFAASQEIPRISRNPKVHYRTHKRPPPVSILGQPNPVHIPTSHFLEIHPNIIHLRLGLPSGLLPSGFPTKTLYTPSPHPYAPHAQPISSLFVLAYLRKRATRSPCCLWGCSVLVLEFQILIQLVTSHKTWY